TVRFAQLQRGSVGMEEGDGAEGGSILARECPVEPPAGDLGLSRLASQVRGSLNALLAGGVLQQETCDLEPACRFDPSQDLVGHLRRKLELPVRGHHKRKMPQAIRMKITAATTNATAATIAIAAAIENVLPNNVNVGVPGMIAAMALTV